MLDRKQIQRIHYNRQALQTDSYECPWEFDPDRHLLSAPYEFCRRWFLSRSLTGKEILDYGCGARALSIDILAKSGALVTGVDISPESVRMARKRAEVTGMSEHYTFEVGDCESLQYDSDRFDYVLSIGTLSCLELNAAYSEISRLLTQNGYFVAIETLGHNPLLNFNRRLKLRKGLKTKWSVDHIIKLKDVQRANHYFHKVEVHYFDLLTPLLVPIASMFGRCHGGMERAVWTLDRRLLSLSGLKPYAFKIVGIFSEPIKPFSPRNFEARHCA